MIGRQRKVMLALLGAVAVTYAGSLTAAWMRGRIADLTARTAQYERLLSQISQNRSGGTGEDSDSSRAASEELATLATELERERSHFYETGELSLTGFSSQIHRTLAAAGLATRRFRPVDPEGKQRSTTLVEFVVQGKAASLLSFLAETSRSPKHHPIPSIAIRRLARAGFIDATFKIGYETIEVATSQ